MPVPLRRSESYCTAAYKRRRAKARIEARLKKSPRLYMLIRWLWITSRWFVLCCRRQIAILFARDISKALDVDKTLWVSPERIVYSSRREFDIHDFKGKVIGGNWDRLGKKFTDLDVYVAFKEVLIEGKKWQETVFYRRIRDSLRTNEFLWGCSNEADIQLRCKTLESLFWTIKTKGYKSQRELQAGQLSDPNTVDDEITISIGRNGDLLFSNGAHRLAVAKLLGIEQIPVKVAVRHPGWTTFAEELLQYSRRQGGKLYQPATHPDLREVPAFHKCEDRFAMIRENMAARGGRLLDIGANLGYFCHRFEDEGFECYAVEASREEIYFMQKLRRAENKRFTIIAKSIYEWPQIENTKFDVVLALNVFHHALKTRQSYYQLLALLHHLQARELFFEPPSNDDSQMEDAYKNYTPSEFLRFIKQNSKFRKAKVIGKAKDGRTMYRLS